MPNRNLNAEVESSLSCPINWHSIIKYDEGRLPQDADYLRHGTILHAIWCWVFSEYAVDAPEIWCLSEIITYGEILRDLDPNEEHTLKNILLRRDFAAEKYDDIVGWLARLKFISPSEHGKHIRLNIRDIEGATKASRSGASIFISGYPEESLSKIFWHWFLDYFDFPIENLLSQDACREELGPYWSIFTKFLHRLHFRMAVELHSVIGASKGVATKFLCFDIDPASAIAHVYPISQSEAIAIMGQVPVPTVPISL